MYIMRPLRRQAFLALPILLLAACAGPGGESLEPGSEGLRLAALGYARRYAELKATYEWGGQDALPRIVVDCSGLVLRCYGYACGDYGRKLPFEDCRAAGMLAWSVPVEPEPGDLVFMGDGGTVSHIALFVRREGGTTWFIDSTYKVDETGAVLVDGVSERSYRSDDPRFIAYGRMLVGK
jgi:hypothetical protein